MRNSAAAGTPHTAGETISIRCFDRLLEGLLAVPPNPKGVVLFSHGSGSSRFSPRNNFVAQALRCDGLATLLIDLLTPEEDLAYENRFDIPLLTDRLACVAEWIKSKSPVKGLPLGLFGASTGAASALILAARLGKGVCSVVSRGGRPDLALDALPKVTAPTLLIVGGNDDVVIDLNRQAMEMLRTEKNLVIVPGATHLFEEPGTLDAVAKCAANWFTKHLPSERRSKSPFHAAG